MPAMALLDTDGVYGAPRFHMAAKKLEIKAHIGAEVTGSCSPRSHGDTGKTNQKSDNRKSTIRIPPCLSVSVVGFAFLSSFPPALAIRTSAA